MMKDKLQVFLQAYQKYKLHRYKLLALLLVVSLVVFGNVFWQLRYTGVTMANEADCRIDEHIHTETCIGYELADLSATDTYSNKLFVLSGTDVFAVSGTDACSLDGSLVISLSDFPSAELYCSVYNCGQAEHIHSTSCYSDDSCVETSEQWTEKIPFEKFTDNILANILETAKSQLYYAESTDNFIVTDDGIKMGYTRYGDWYGNKYGKWDTMFVSFCMYYANVPSSIFPYEAGAQTLAAQLKAAELYTYPEDFDAVLTAGSVIFFETTGDDGVVRNRTGIVSSVNNDRTITVIEGDCFVGTLAPDNVAENTYSLSDSSIVGCYTVPITSASEAASSYIMTTDLTEGESTESTVTIADYTDFSNWVSSITYGTVTYEYDSTANTYVYKLSDVVIGFPLEKGLTAGDVKKSGDDYIQYYTLPKELQLNNALAAIEKTVSLIAKDEQGNDIEEPAYTFSFVYDETAGVWKVKINWKESFINNLSDEAPLSGSISFGAGAYLTSDAQDENGNVTIGGSTVATPNDVVYDTNKEDNKAVTPNYDLEVTKDGSYISSGGTDYIQYTIRVTSNNGTPSTSQIDLTDTISDAGEIINLPVEEFKVTQRVFETYNSWYTVSETPVELAEGSLTLPESGSELFQVYLPAINDTDGSGNTDSENKYSTQYVITYKVPLDQIADGQSYYTKNGIVINIDDTSNFNEDITVKTDDSITVKKNMLQKWNSATSDGKIKWVITVNSGEENIYDHILADAMFSDAVGDIEVYYYSNNTTSSAENYEYITDDNGKVTGIKFTAPNDETGVTTGSNTSTYQIIYYTDSFTSWNDISISNTAYLTQGNTEYSISSWHTVYGNKPTKEFVSYHDENTEEGKESSTLRLLTWKSQIYFPSEGIYAGAFIEDNISGSGSDSLNARDVHYMTYEQVTALIKDYFSITGPSGATYSDTSFYVKGYDSNLSSYYFYYYNEGTWYRCNWAGENFCTYSDTAYTAVSVDDVKSVHFTYFRICFDTAIDSATYGEGYVPLTYTTTLEKKDITSQYTANNKISNDQWKSAEASHTYRLTVFKTDGNNKSTPTEYSYAPGNCTVTWKVTVVIPDNYTSESGAIVVEDKLPDGVTLDNVTLTYYNRTDGNYNYNTVYDIKTNTTTYIPWQDVNWGEHKNDITLFYTEDTDPEKDNIVTVTIPDATKINNAGANVFILTYVCTIDDVENGTYEDYEKYALTNNATVKINGEDYGSASQKQTIQVVVPSTDIKRDSFNSSNNTITYTVDVNRTAADLNSSGDTITVTDNLKYWENYNGTALTISLVPGSIHLYKAETDSEGNPIYYSDEACTVPSGNTKGYLKKGEELSTSAYLVTQDKKIENGASHSILTLTIPDKTAFVLEYQYAVSGTKENDTTGSYYAYNEFKAADGTVSQNQSQSNFSLVNADGTIATDRTLTIYKQDADNIVLFLPGAVFQLYKYDATTSTYVKVEGTTYTTNQYGVLILNWNSLGLEKNTAYYLVESAAPTGYVLNTDEKVYFCYTDANKTSSSPIPADFEGFDFGSSDQQSAKVTIKNTKKSEEEPEPENTKLTVTKYWETYEGEAVTKTEGSVTGKIYRVARGGNVGGSSQSATLDVTFWSLGSIDDPTDNTGQSPEESLPTYSAGDKIKVTVYPPSGLSGDWLKMSYKFNDFNDTAEYTQFYADSNYYYSFEVELKAGNNVLLGKISEEYKTITFTTTEPSGRDSANYIVYIEKVTTSPATVSEIATVAETEITLPTTLSATLNYWNSSYVDGNVSSFSTYSESVDITVDSTATASLNYVINYSDLGISGDTGNSPNVYIQINGLQEILSAANKTVSDLEVYVTVKSYGTSEDSTKETVHIDNQVYYPYLSDVTDSNNVTTKEVQIGIYSPWSDNRAQFEATWTEHFDVSVTIKLPELTIQSETPEDDETPEGGENTDTETLPEFYTEDNNKVKLDITLTNDKSKAEQDSSFTETVDNTVLYLNAGTVITPKIYITNNYANWDGLNVLSSIFGTPTKTVEDLGDGNYLHIQDYSPYTLDSDVTIDESLGNSEITTFKYVFSEEDIGTEANTAYIYLDIAEPVIDAEEDEYYYIEYVDTFEITADDNWTLDFENLSSTGTDANGNTVQYTYYVVEDPVSLHTTSYSYVEDGVIYPVSTDGSITITNTQFETYDLPETGGFGTAMFVSVALLLFMWAGLMLKQNLMMAQAETAYDKTAFHSQATKNPVRNVFIKAKQTVCKFLQSVRKKL